MQLWNRIPGVARIKKFTDRPTALKRIWAAIKVLEPVHPPTTDVPPSEGGPSTTRPGTKKAIVLELLSRSEGASVHEIMAALGWQSHSVRGYLSSLSKQGTGIHSFRRSDGDRAYSINTETESKAEGAQIVARTDPAWILKKGGEDCIVAERIRLSPAPWLGGWAGKQLRFLSVSRGQSILTDVQPGSLALNRRVTGLPLMQRMWFSRQGHSLGYMKPRGSADPAELFFFDSEARLSSKQQLPAAVADASDGTEQWFVACRNGRVYGFSLDGVPLWNELVPNARRDQSTNGEGPSPVSPSVASRRRWAGPRNWRGTGMPLLRTLWSASLDQYTPSTTTAGSNHHHRHPHSRRPAFQAGSTSDNT